ncbi:UAA transporter family, partial [Musa troglodytarum]
SSLGYLVGRTSSHSSSDRLPQRDEASARWTRPTSRSASLSSPFVCVRGEMNRPAGPLFARGEKAAMVAADLIRRCGEGGITYGYLLLYIALSSGQIFFNKWVLSSKQINFPYPVALTLLHMLFSSVLCFLLTKVFKVIKIEGGIYSEIACRCVFLGAAVGLEALSCRMFTIMSVISVGVVVASYGEISISWIGVVYQMGGVVGESLRLIFMEIFVKKKGVRLNSISMMYYVSPCSALCLFVPWIFLEKPKMDSSGPWNFPPIILGLNCLCTFALNLSVFLVISRTSALTIRVAGVVRDWVVVLLSALIFSDSKLTIINLIGYGIAISGIVAYNNHKLKNEASEIKSVVDVDADDQGKSQDDQAALIPPLKENT